MLRIPRSLEGSIIHTIDGQNCWQVLSAMNWLAGGLAQVFNWKFFDCDDDDDNDALWCDKIRLFS